MGRIAKKKGTPAADAELDLFIAGIKLLMKEAGLKQNQFASVVGLTAPYICQIFSGKHRSVPLVVCLAMAKALDTSIDEVIAIGRRLAEVLAEKPRRKSTHGRL